MSGCAHGINPGDIRRCAIHQQGASKETRGQGLGWGRAGVEDPMCAAERHVSGTVAVVSLPLFVPCFESGP